MIDKRASYSDKNFAKHLKGLGLSEEEIKYILNETKRKKFESGGDGGGGDGGGGDGGSSGGDGDGSSDGSGGGVGGDDGAGASNAGDAGIGTGDSAGVGGSGDSTGSTGVGSGPGGEEGTGGVSAANAAANSDEGVVSAVTGFARNAITNAINNPIATAIGVVNPVAGLAARAIGMAIDAANRGVTPANDFSQATTSVQSNTQGPANSGGIATIQQYAPTYNPDTGNPTMDSYMRRLRVNLGLPV
jgi:hypothetical protein